MITDNTPHKKSESSSGNLPVLSIITVTKNNRHGLRSTARTLIHQLMSDIQWIIIDGESHDGTAADLERLKEKAEIVSEEDDGLYNAMNKGLSIAKGRYLLFLNAGDQLADRDSLSTILKTLKATKPDFLYGDSLEGSLFYKKARSHKKWRWGMFTHHQAMIYSRRLFKNLSYDETYKIAADYDLTIRFLDSSTKIEYIPCALCLFETGGISQEHAEDGRTEQFFIRLSHGRTPFALNILIYLFQTGTYLFRKTFPETYAKIQNRRSGKIQSRK